MGDLDVVHGLITTGKPEVLCPVCNVCILVRKKCMDTQQIGSVLMWNSTQ